MSGRVLGEYLELTKPRITCFILMSTAIGFLCAEHLVGSFSWLVLFHALMGTALLASGTAALNQWYEREGDGKMRRTRKRPIPSGRMTPKAAFEFGLMLSIVGFLELWLRSQSADRDAGSVHRIHVPLLIHAAETRSRRIRPPSARFPARCLR